MLQRDPSRCSGVANFEVAAPVKGVTPVKEVEGTQPLEICQQSAGLEYLQFQCPVLQMFCSFLVVLTESHLVAIRSGNLWLT
jgi:hypothetical protein